MYIILKKLKHTMDYDIYYIEYPSVLKGFLDAGWITNQASTSGWILNLSRRAIFRA